MVTAAGLSARVEPIRRIHPSVETGRVAEQDPGAGVPTRRSRRVKVWLAGLKYRRRQRQRVLTLLGALRRGEGADIYWISGLLRNIASFVLARA